MAKRVSAGWHVSSAGYHPRPALLGLSDTLPGVLSWLGSRDVARLRRVCRELRDCGESASQAAVARRGEAFGPDSAKRRAFQSRFAAAPNKHEGVAATSISLPDEPWLRAEPFSRQPWLEVLRDLEAHECPLQFSAPSDAHTSHDPAHHTSTVSLLPGATIPPIFAAVCQHNVMRTGVHAVMITVNDHGAIVAGGAAFWRLGIVSREYARAAPFSVASASEHGWGLAPCGAVFHRGSALATVFGTKEWSVGDPVRLQLDVEAGLLWGFTNNEPVRLLANVRQPGTSHSGWLWCVDMCKAAGASVTIRRATIQQIEGAAAIVERQQHPFGVIGGQSFSF
jgi:hypothetical protein